MAAMSAGDGAMSTNVAALPAGSEGTGRKWIGVAVALAVLAAAVLMPPLAGLPVAGQRAIGILLFAVVLWVTEAVDLTVSAFIIMALIILLIGTAPDVQNAAN